MSQPGKLTSPRAPVTDDIREAKRRLVAKFRPEKIILFGSQARGTADSRSDVDLLVVLPFTGNRRRLFVQMDLALSGIPQAFDLVIRTPEQFARSRAIPGQVDRYAAQEGRVIYARRAA